MIELKTNFSYKRISSNMCRWSLILKLGLDLMTSVQSIDYEEGKISLQRRNLKDNSHYLNQVISVNIPVPPNMMQ